MTLDLRDALQAIAGLLSQLRNQVTVSGSTARAVADTALYESNWQLSLWKALAVSNELKAAGYPGPRIAKTVARRGLNGYNCHTA